MPNAVPLLTALLRWISCGGGRLLQLLLLRLLWRGDRRCSRVQAVCLWCLQAGGRSWQRLRLRARQWAYVAGRVLRLLLRLVLQLLLRMLLLRRLRASLLPAQLLQPL
jgi:hypothetical protein